MVELKVKVKINLLEYIWIVDLYLIEFFSFKSLIS